MHKKEKIKTFFLQFSIFAFFCSIPIGTKKFIMSFCDGTSEFDSLFLFASDFVFIFILLFFILGYGEPKNALSALLFFVINKRKIFWLFLFLCFSVFSVFLSPSPLLGVCAFFRLFFSSIQFLFIYFLFEKKIISYRLFAWSIVLSALFQSVLGFLQFILQKSVGAWFLGESVIYEFSQNVARIFVSGAPFLRAYGTMAHANILAGFLALGLFACLYLWISKKEEIYFFPRAQFLQKKILFPVVFSLSLFSILIGLALTFSRSGWIVAVFGTTLIFLLGFLYKKTRKRTAGALLVFLFSLTILFFSLGWAIFPRASLSLTEPSVNYRILYNQIGKDIISERPMGVGVGSQVIFSEKRGLYEKHGITEKNDFQPIHNLFILITSETGIFGIASFLFFLLSSFFPSFRVGQILNFLKNAPPEYLFSATALLSLLLFGLFDHFLWTIQAGRLMLWVFLGLVFSAQFQNNTSASS